MSPVLARTGHGAMSALSLLSGVKRKSGLRAVRSVVDPEADIEWPSPQPLNLLLFSASHVEELEKIFAKAEGEGAGAILVNDHPVFGAGNGKLITDLAARYKIPVMYPGRGYVAAGGLISYGSDGKEANRQLGDLVGRVLRGEKPEDLPVQQVTKLELVINAKIAKSLGLAIPLPLLGLAEVIE